MSNFQERYTPLLETVCRMLGNGWKVNHIRSWEHRVFITSPNFKHYSISVAYDKGRLKFLGSVDSRLCRVAAHSCSVCPKRDQSSIAADIQRKIISYAPDEIAKTINYEQGYKDSQEHKIILKGMLSRLVSLSSCYNALTAYTTSSGIRGRVEERGSGYELRIDDLSTDELIRIVGFVSEMKRDKG